MMVAQFAIESGAFLDRGFCFLSGSLFYLLEKFRHLIFFAFGCKFTLNRGFLISFSPSFLLLYFGGFFFRRLLGVGQ